MRVFIILSGFVITHLVIERPESYPAYLTRRFMRIFPVFAVTCFVGYFANDLQAALISQELLDREFAAVLSGVAASNHTYFIVLRPHPAISQQHGFVHGGAVSAIADSAAGYSALTLMPADTGVLTTEFKINLLAPAAGERIVARGRVVKAGRTLTLTQAEVFADTGGQEKLIALLTATLMAIKGRDDVSD